MKVKNLKQYEIDQLMGGVLNETPIDIGVWLRNKQVKESFDQSDLEEYIYDELEKQLIRYLKSFEKYTKLTYLDIRNILKNCITLINEGPKGINEHTHNIQEIVKSQISNRITQQIVKERQEAAEFKNLLTRVEKMVDNHKRPNLISRISQVFKPNPAIEFEKKSIQSLELVIAQVTKSTRLTSKFQRKGYSDLIPKTSSKKEILLAALESCLLKKENELPIGLITPITNILKKFTTGSMAETEKRTKVLEKFKQNIEKDIKKSEEFLKAKQISLEAHKKLGIQDKRVTPPPGYKKSLKKRHAYLKKVNTEWKKTYARHQPKTTKISFVNIDTTNEDNKKEDKKAMTDLVVKKTGYDRKNRYWRDPFSNEEHQKMVKKAKENRNKTSRSILKRK